MDRKISLAPFGLGVWEAGNIRSRDSDLETCRSLRAVLADEVP